MKWEKKDNSIAVPIKSWCEDIEDEALKQAKNLANHPIITNHVALMPDCHVGYGMPIGGVIACENGVIPNAVGVDIGCGMGAVETDILACDLRSKEDIREVLDYIKKRIPVGEGHAHKEAKKWDGFTQYLSSLGLKEENLDYNNNAIPKWLDKKGWILAYKNLGTLGGGNHFIEIQESDKGNIWLMLHSGSRNLGHRIASYYHQRAKIINSENRYSISSPDLSFLYADTKLGKAYIRDMNFALDYASQSRRRMMSVVKEAISFYFQKVNFLREINIHHNYASFEEHFGKKFWVHRKGATSAKNGEKGIIPGSMGTNSYIVEGLGNPESFMSCSHGAGRRMGRMQASRNLTLEECDQSMEGIVFDRWNKVSRKRRKFKKGGEIWDFGEAPLAYKDIDEVIEAELDLIKPLVKLKPMGVVKG